MSRFDFNSAQLKAIETLDKNVSVSAGAGSGKTGVLVERFCRLVRDGHAGPDEILTVTFTEKAAKEMKSRIVERFADWFSEAGDQRFTVAARAVESACIGTIHAFAARVLRENTFAAGVDPQFKVITEIEAELLKERVLDDLTAAGFTGGRPAYVDLVPAYGHRGTIRAVKDLYAQLSSLGRDSAAVAPASATVADLAEAAAAYLDAAAAILGYNGNITDKLAAALDKFYTLYPQIKEAMIGAVADLEKDGRAEFTRRFDWARYELIERAGKLLPGATGGNEFQNNFAKPAKEAAKFFLQLMLAPLSAHYSDCLLEVTGDFEREYAAVKHRSGRLDFDDLLLTVKGLLIGPDGQPTATADGYSRRFKYAMIDEFQDTNALQKSLIESVCPPQRFFTVGDVKQSIFSFMHSEVSVFEAHHRATRKGGGEIIPLVQNYRSRQEVIDFINRFFSDLWLEDDEFNFEALRAEGSFHPTERREVELLWVEKSDKENSFSGAERQRATEARAIAARIRSLLGLDGGAPFLVTKKGPGSEGPRPLTPADIFILFRSTANIKVYEQALADAGLDYYVVSGRGFYAAQEVQDILNLLRVVENPLDDLAMAAVFRSPMVAVSDDTLWWLANAGSDSDTASDQPEVAATPGGRQAGKLYFALRNVERLDAVDPADRARLTAFRDTLHNLHLIRSESRLTRLIDLAVKRTAYDLKLLASPQGKQQYANLRKLVEAAGEFGAAGVFQLPDFIRYVEQMKIAAEREGEAPTESEESRVIRLMTIHKAKGLQAPVVVVADCSRKMRLGPGGKPFLFDKELGLAAKVRSPVINDWLTPWPFANPAERARERDLAEEKRLFYVAATRAEELLIFSGASAFDGKSAAKEFYNEIGSWLGWLEKALEMPGPPGAGDIAIDNRGLRLRCLDGAAQSAPAPGACETFAATYREALLAGEQLPVAAGPTPDIELMTAGRPVGTRPVVLNVSRAVDYLACPRQFHLRWTLGVPEPALGAAKRNGEPGPAVGADVVGIAVHEVLAAMNWAGDPKAHINELVAAQDSRLREQVRACCDRFLESDWPARIAAGSNWFQEAPFSLELENCRLYGRIDLLLREPGGWIIVDYKTGAAGAESYGAQVRLYALALEKCLGETPAEVALVALGGGDDFIQPVDRALMAETEAMLVETAALIKSGATEGPRGPGCHRCGYLQQFCAPSP